jgi:uncharacterized membrane protein (Fun14 family)
MVVENLLFSFGGGTLLGYFAGKAVKVVAKIAAIIIGLFILGLAYLSYRGWIDVHWRTVEEQTQSAMYNASHTATQMLNDTASKYATHPAMFESQALPIAAVFGFIPGMAYGLRH